MAQCKLIFAAILITLLLFIGGFLIGYFTSPDRNKDSDCDNENEKISENARFKDHEKLYKMLDAERIRQYLRYDSCHLGYVLYVSSISIAYRIVRTCCDHMDINIFVFLQYIRVLWGCL